MGGVVPEIAARNHLEKITPLLSVCLEEANISFKDIDQIGVTTNPGLLAPFNGHKYRKNNFTIKKIAHQSS